MSDPIPIIPGADALAKWFGYWPSFHDAEIHELYLNRQGMSWLKIHTWRMTDKVDDKGYYILEKHILVTFHMQRIITLLLEDFSHQNVIFGLDIEKTDTGFALAMQPCFGLSGMIEAEEITVEFTPRDGFAA